MKKGVVDKHYCQMDEAAGAIRSVYDAKKCCGIPTDHFFVHRRKKYFLCTAHLAVAALLAMGYVVGVDGNRT